MKLCLILCHCLLFVTCAFADEAELRIYTEEYPPYNYWQEDQLRGISTEVVRDVLERAKLGVSITDVQLVPWARGYNETLHRKNTAIFGMARTKERENLFKWVGPIGCARIGIIGRKCDEIKIRELNDLKDYSVGVVRDDVGHQLIRKELPWFKMDVANSSEANLFKLRSGRVDLFVYDLNAVDYMLRKLSLLPGEFETVYVLLETPFSIGFNLDTDEKVLRKFQKAFDEVVQAEKVMTCK